MLERPLAEKMRPNSLDEIIGHDKITGKDGILRKIINSKKPTSLIFWGPAGIGKTTLARILANELNANFIELSAVTAKKQDVIDVIKEARINKAARMCEEGQPDLSVLSEQGSGGICRK